ncbi:unnamed protein product, partial [Effrenium voratum]
ALSWFVGRSAIDGATGKLEFDLLEVFVLIHPQRKELCAGGVAGAAGAKAPRQGIFSHSAALGRPLRDRALREASDCQQLQIATAAACKARLQSEAGNYKQARLASNGPAAEPTDMARKLTEAALWILCYSPETLLLRHGVY